MADFKTSIKITGDASGAQRAVGDAVHSLEQLEAKSILSEKALSGVNNIIGGSAAKFALLSGSIAVVAALYEAIKTVADQTIEAQNAQAQLDAAIRSTGGAAGLSAEQLTELAKSLSQVSTYSDNSIISAEALLLRFRGIGNDFPRVTKATLDLATRLGIDLPAAAQIMGKALQDPINGLDGLTKKGVVFSASQKEAIRTALIMGDTAKAQNIILGETERAFGGAAEAARNTFGGALAGLKNQVGSLFEEKGGLKEGTKALNDLSTSIAAPEFMEGFDTLVTGLAKTATALAGLVLYIPIIAAIRGLASLKQGAADAANVASGVGRFLQYGGPGGAYGAMQAFNGGSLPGVPTGAALPDPAKTKAAADAVGQLTDEQQKLLDQLQPLTKLEQDHRDRIAGIHQIVTTLHLSQGKLNALLGEENRQYEAKRLSLDTLSRSEKQYADWLYEVARASQEQMLAEGKALQTMQRLRIEASGGADVFGQVTEFTDRYRDSIVKAGLDVTRFTDEIQAQGRAYFKNIIAPGDAGVEKMNLIAAAARGVRAVFAEKGGIFAMMDDGAKQKALDEALGNITDHLLGIKDAATQLQDSFSIIADSFDAIGGSAGHAFAGITRGLANVADYSQKQAEINKAVHDQNRAYTDAENTALSQLAARQIGAYGDMASAAAGFFKEGSTGYRTLMAVSQAYHAVELAMTIAQIGKAAIAAVLNQAQGDPYTAFARMAAMAAIVAGLGVAIGGAVSGGDTGANLSADRQKTDGTGTILGDAAAKSESIAKSLEAIKAISGSGLSYSELMLQQLRAINVGINGFGALLYRQNGGGATPFAGFSQGRSFTLGRTGDLIGDLFSPAFGGHLDPLGNKIPGLSQTVNFMQGLASKIVNGIFGSTSYNLADTGITFDPSQQLGSILGGGSTAASYYGDIHEHTGSLFGLANRDSVSRDTQGLDPQAQAQIDQIIRGLGTTILTSVQALGADADQARTIIDNKKIGDLLKQLDLSLQGLSGDDLNKAVSSFFSELGDSIAAAAVPQIGQFQKVGEGLFETLARVASESYAVTHAMTDLGIAFAGLDWLQRATISEQLIALAGGVDQLGSSISSFIDKFYTDQEKADMAASQFGSALGQLGIAVPTTREAFKQLVQGLDLTTAAGQQAFVTLTGLADVADQYFSAIKDAQQAVLDAAERQKQTISDQADAAIAALEAQKSALKDQASGLSAVISKWQELANSLRDFAKTMDGLIVAHSANVTASLQAQFNQLSAKASLGNQDAMTQLPGVGQALSQQILATASTREQAVIQLAAVRNQALAAAATAQRQESIAQRQLDALNAQQDTLDAQIQAEKDWRDAQIKALDDQLTALGLIQNNTLTMAQAVAQLVALQQRAQQTDAAAAVPTTTGSTITNFGSVGIVPPAANIARSEDALNAQRDSTRELKSLNARMERIEAALVSSAKANVKTAKILERVTPDGSSLATSVAA